jgi:hypothetical protein
MRPWWTERASKERVLRFLKLEEGGWEHHQRFQACLWGLDQREKILLRQVTNATAQSELYQVYQRIRYTPGMQMVYHEDCLFYNAREAYATFRLARLILDHLNRSLPETVRARMASFVYSTPVIQDRLRQEITWTVYRGEQSAVNSCLLQVFLQALPNDMVDVILDAQGLIHEEHQQLFARMEKAKRLRHIITEGELVRFMDLAANNFSMA